MNGFLGDGVCVVLCVMLCVMLCDVVNDVVCDVVIDVVCGLHVCDGVSGGGGCVKLK